MGTDFDFAWAAGLFEGEGSLSWTRKQSERAYPTAKLSMTDEDVVLRFASVIGIGKITLPKRREGRKQLYSWRAFGAPAMRRLDETIGPWLGVRRRAKLDEMLTFVPLRETGRGRWLGVRSFSESGQEAMRENGRRRARLDSGQVREVRERLARGEAQRAIARDLGVGRTTIHNIAAGRARAHIS